MPLPSDATKVHLDSGTDDPKQARVELADLIDKYNALKNAMGNIVELGAGDGIKDDGAGNLAVDLATDSGLEIAGQKLQANVTEGIQRKASEAGLALDINGLIPENTLDAINDFIAVYDASAGAHRKASPKDVFGANVASQAEAEAGTDNTKGMTPLRTAQLVGGTQTQVFTANGTYNVPDGVTSVLVEAVGGGGGGGGGITSQHHRAGGGGGGGAHVRVLVSVTSGGAETVTIGQGGTAGVAGYPTSTAGGAGGNTTFGSKVTAGGGGGGGGAVANLYNGGGGGGGIPSTTGTRINLVKGNPGSGGNSSSYPNIGGNGGKSALFGSLDLDVNEKSTGGRGGNSNASGASGIDGYMIITLVA